jgi:hypothetical protein
MLKTKIWACFQKRLNFLPKNFSLTSQKYEFGNGVRDPGSGKKLFRISEPGPGVKKAPNTGSGSATLPFTPQKLSLSSQKYKLGIRDPRIRKKPIPDHRSRSQKGTGSRIRIPNVAKKGGKKLKIVFLSSWIGSRDPRSGSGKTYSGSRMWCNYNKNLLT